MKKTKYTRTAREHGFIMGQMQPGPMNLITDVSGVRVGHATISRRDVQTGVTSVLPHGGNLFQEKLIAASHVINGRTVYSLADFPGVLNEQNKETS